MRKVKLGDKLIDKVTGFTGVAVAKHTYLNGCNRFSLQPPIDKDSKLPDTQTFDEPQLEVVKKSVAKKDKGDTGGPEKYSDSKRPGE